MRSAESDFYGGTEPFVRVDDVKAWAPRLRPNGRRVPRRLKKRLSLRPFTCFYRGAIVCSAPGYSLRISAVL